MRTLAIVVVLAASACNGGASSQDTCSPAGGVCNGFKAGCPPGYGGTGDTSLTCPADPATDPQCCMPNGTGKCGPILCPARSLCSHADPAATYPTCTPLDGRAPTCGTLTCGDGCTCQSATTVPPVCSCP